MFYTRPHERKRAGKGGKGADERGVSREENKGGRTEERSRRINLSGLEGRERKGDERQSIARDAGAGRYMDIRAEEFMLSLVISGAKRGISFAEDNYLDDDNVIWTTRTMSLLTINIIEILPTE